MGGPGPGQNRLGFHPFRPGLERRHISRGDAPRWCTIEQLEWDRVMIPNRQTRKECCRLPRRPARDALYHPIKCDAAGVGASARRKAAIDVCTWKGKLPHRIVPTAQGRLNLSAMDADRVPAR